MTVDRQEVSQFLGMQSLTFSDVYSYSSIKLEARRSSTPRFQSESSLSMHLDHASTTDHTPSGKSIIQMSCMVSVTSSIVNLGGEWTLCYTPSALTRSDLILQSLSAQSRSLSYHSLFVAVIFVLLRIHPSGSHHRSGLTDLLDRRRNYLGHGSRPTELSEPC